MLVVVTDDDLHLRGLTQVVGGEAVKVKLSTPPLTGLLLSL